MEINKHDARSILHYMKVAHGESRLHYSELAWAVELAKFAELGDATIAKWQKEHDEEEAMEDFYEAQESYCKSPTLGF